MKIKTEHPIAFIRRMFFLAYNASDVYGMGFLQEKEDASEEEVWKNIQNCGDYPGPTSSVGGKFVADYVFGHMMKLYITVEGDTISFNDKWKPDCQSFCTVYTPQSLVDSTAKSLGVTYETVEDKHEDDA